MAVGCEEEGGAAEEPSGSADAGEEDIGADVDDVDAPDGLLPPESGLECGAVEYFEGDEFGNLCLVAEPPVPFWTDDDPESWGWNTLENTLARHQMQCSSLPPDLRTRSDFRAWQQAGRSVLRRLLRVDAERWPQIPLTPRELGEVEQTDAWTLWTVDYAVAPGQRIPADLYVPTAAGPHPAVVFFHGHDEGGRAAASGREPWLAESNYHRGAARALADEGWVVLAPDVRGFGETGSWAQHRRHAEILTLEGRVAYGVFVADAMRAVDYLVSREDVDPSRVALAGVSMGGQIALYTTALDDRVDTAVVAGHLGSFNRLLLETRQDPCQYIPLLDRFFDIADVAMLAAPAHVLFLVGDRDPLYPLAEAQAAWDTLRAAWALLDAEADVQISIESGGHAWFPAPAAQYLQRVFGARGARSSAGASGPKAMPR